MSVVIAVKVSEGLVLAADSAATLVGKIGAQQGVLKTFYNARKLLQIGDFPIGVLTWGQAFIGSRTLESHIREWEHHSQLEVLEKHLATNDTPYKLRECTESLKAHLGKVYKEEFGNLPTNNRPIVGVLVGGFSHGQFFPEIWRFDVASEEGLIDQRPDINGKPDFGASWFGQIDSLVRLHFGVDEGAYRAIVERFKIDKNELRTVLEPAQYRIPFAAMPLQDAIEYAYYMVNIAIGRHRFALGPELCGGEVDIAVITQRKFEWISRKAWRIDN